LAGVVANGDSENWVIGDADGNYGLRSSLWQNSNTLGSVTSSSWTTNADFKSPAWNRFTASEIMIYFKDQFLLRTVTGCLSTNLRSRFDSLTFDCEGSQDSSGNDARLHPCAIAAYTARSGEPILTFGGNPSYLYLKAGEAEGVQDGNKDRSMISTNLRSNIDYACGLGSFCQQSSDRTTDCGIQDDNSVRSGDTSIYYSIWVR